MKLLLLGSNGQLGYEATRTFFCLGELITADYPIIDFSKPDKVLKFLNEIKPDLIYNAAAYTDVDKAELEPEKAMIVNCITPGEIANYCKTNHIPLIHFSTDYVFDGQKGTVYLESDNPNPINVYGKTKLSGEQAIIDSQCSFFIFRTSWVYSKQGDNFVNKVMKWSQEKDILKIVDDQIGNPTWARLLAILSSRLIGKTKNETINLFGNKRGVYHLAGGGHTSRYEWAKSIVELLPKEAPVSVREIFPTKSEEFLTPAKRPKFSALNCEKFENTFSIKIPHWKTSLKLMLES